MRSSGRTARGLLAYALLLLLASQPGCKSGDPLQRASTALGNPAHREKAIDQLLVLVRRAAPAEKAELQRRAAHALMDAYRTDDKRDHIVAALALLGEPAAREVFVAAVKDYQREGTYAEAAARAARALGTLRLREAVPALLEILQGARRQPHGQAVWIQREIVSALDAIGDPRAADVLIEVLRTNPLTQDVYLNRLAARALGGLRSPAAIEPLIETLAAPPFGRLLFEESRRALCRIGQSARPALLRAAELAGPAGAKNATAESSLRLLADLGASAELQGLAAKAGDASAPSTRLTLAAALLRSGQLSGAASALQLLSDPATPLTIRGRAADLLGWYGDPASGDALATLLERDGSAMPAALLWSVARAYARVGPTGGAALLEKLSKEAADPATRANLATYAERFAVLDACAAGKDAACLFRQLRAASWRRQERAALELARLRTLPELAPALELLEQDNLQVRRAVLLLLERAKLSGPAREDCVRRLRDLATRRDDAFEMPDELRSEALCLATRLEQHDGRPATIPPDPAP